MMYNFLVNSVWGSAVVGLMGHRGRVPGVVIVPRAMSKPKII